MYADNIEPEDLHILSYDDTISYEEQVDQGGPALATRIGHTKVYLLSDSAVPSSLGKHKRSDDDDDDDEGASLGAEGAMDEVYRPNALLLNGSPISELPTARIFAYATLFDAHPLALEWVDDMTCVVVFKSSAAAMKGLQCLQKSPTEVPNTEGYLTAKPIPLALWPPEKVTKNNLSWEERLTGTIHIRWAMHDDVKKQGARQESQFYKKHGLKAGKELFDGQDLPPTKRRRDENDLDFIQRKAQLDDELDRFLADGDQEEEKEATPLVTDDGPFPVSKMRSDYIAQDGKTLLQRTSAIRMHFGTLEDRMTVPLPRRVRGGSRRPSDMFSGDRLESSSVVERERVREENSDSRTRRERQNMTRHSVRPHKTQQELDDELDNFLRGGDGG